MKHTVAAVTPGSPADELSAEPGDILLSVNGRQIRDVFDYRFQTQSERVTLEIQKPDGEVWELDIEKDAYEDVGLQFPSALMDEAKRCNNRCVFCFIDQMPPRLRGTLYVKDDDPRLSFLTGNYVTLTNITKREAARIAAYHLSPLKISVHAADLRLRSRMMGNPDAARLFDILDIFKNAGITLHFQIVLCKGLNDGPALDYTIERLLEYRPNAESLSVVPVGLTKHREGLEPLGPFNQAEAAAVIKQIKRWQAFCIKRYNTAFVYCADELYLKAKCVIPPYQHYGDFPQLENGVGMLALFKHDFLQALERVRNKKLNHQNDNGTERLKIALATGRAAGPFMRELMRAYTGVNPCVTIKVYEVINDFFGPDVTVSGLLTGGDVVEQLKKRVKKDKITTLFLPRNMFRADGAVTLDNMTAKEIAAALRVKIKIGDADGRGFLKQLMRTS